MILCVTGKMAGGKNAVCKILEEHNFYSIDLDVLVHDVIPMVEDKLIDLFESKAKENNLSLKNPDGYLNRRVIGQLVFKEPVLLAKHEAIIYPVLTKLVMQKIEEHKNQNIILNATVLYKTPELLSLCSTVVFVDSPFVLRFFRALKRDKMPAKQILNRFNNQKGLLTNYQKAFSPVIKINNCGSIRHLKKQIYNNLLQFI